MGLAGFCSDEFVMNPALWYAVVVLILSVVSFLLYGWDKRQAKLDRWRAPEKNFHLLSVLGGWPGAIAGQQFFRHKTQKQPFRSMFWLTVILNVALVSWAIYQGFFFGVVRSH